MTLPTLADLVTEFAGMDVVEWTADEFETRLRDAMARLEEAGFSEIEMVRFAGYSYSLTAAAIARIHRLEGER